MDDATYDRLTAATLDALVRGLDALDADEVDATVSHGVLGIEIEGGPRLYVSRQPPMHQLWLATPDGGFKFDREGDRWVDQRTGRELGEALSDAVGRALAREVRLEAP